MDIAAECDGYCIVRELLHSVMDPAAECDCRYTVFDNPHDSVEIMLSLNDMHPRLDQKVPCCLYVDSVVPPDCTSPLV